MLIPTIHLNGSSGERLLEQYTAASAAVRAAISTLQEVDVNARDYYVQGENAPQAAQREHDARLMALRRIDLDLAMIVEGIQDQLDASDAARGRR